MCDKINHPLVEVYRAGGGDYSPAHVVMWCPDCGAVVVDAEMDGRTYPGKVLPMQHPHDARNNR